ncbi:diacylglycerol/lipid kinase family protein [Treponema parvum]|uniref:diacylglycerol/lipid kinase family protein n=1 Tax=Treponema parvum TaxID=138851 RepID=UPI001AEBE9AD|nr:diacylglycerol kinase family protein [Treponema parvum]QTQ16859.1 diacylglycerol kinase family protein [Treponema parvum]
MIYVFYNPLANNKKAKKDLSLIASLLTENDVSFFDVTQEKNVKSLLVGLSPNDTAVIAGGDGTLHRFVNMIYDDFGSPSSIHAKLLFFPSGSGNDFMHDIHHSKEKKLIDLKKYIENLPSVSINDKIHHFINGTGAGLDGWCCYEAEKSRQKNGKPINYTLIAAKGLLYAYKPFSATAVVDGIPHRYNDIWLISSMNGRYFGGGMKVAPEQDRLAKDKTVSFVAAHSLKRRQTFRIFPEFLSGKYVRHKNYIDVIPAKKITVTFDNPVTIQIDGESFPNVTSYSVDCVR